MSQHHLAVEIGGRAAEIMMGWDRPLQGFHCIVTVEPDDDLAYCNLDDLDLLSSFGLAQDVDHYVARLAELGLTVPQQMLDAIRGDGLRNVGNRSVWWDAEGNQIARP